MFAHLYRFRPIERLLDENELQKQEIYFADPADLNDPMEGFRDVWWKGDDVVWENLFRHYITCLEWAYSMLSIGGEGKPVGWNDAVFTDGGTGATHIYTDRLSKLVSAFLDGIVVHSLIQALAKRAVPVRRDELGFYLRSIHGFALSVIDQNYSEHGLSPPRGKDPRIQKHLEHINESTRQVIANIAQLEAERANAETEIAGFFAAQNEVASELTFLHTYNGTFDADLVNRNFVLIDFPIEYVRNSKRLRILIGTRPASRATHTTLQYGGTMGLNTPASV